MELRTMTPRFSANRPGNTGPDLRGSSSWASAAHLHFQDEATQVSENIHFSHSEEDGECRRKQARAYLFDECPPPFANRQAKGSTVQETSRFLRRLS
jgi:hypothetical protein